MKLVSLVALAMVAGANAAVTFVNETAFTGSPVVQFESPTSPVTSYSEAGLTLTAPAIYFYGTSDKSAAVNHQTNLFSFQALVTRVGFEEQFSRATSVTLYSDAAGIASLGTFDITHTGTYGVKQFFGFESSVPFRSAAITGAGPTFWIDDLRYIPEPTAAVVAVLGGLAVTLGGRRRKHD